jgi:hypothetical protein
MIKAKPGLVLLAGLLFALLSLAGFKKLPGKGRREWTSTTSRPNVATGAFMGFLTLFLGELLVALQTNFGTLEGWLVVLEPVVGFVIAYFAPAYRKAWAALVGAGLIPFILPLQGLFSGEVIFDSGLLPDLRRRPGAGRRDGRGGQREDELSGAKRLARGSRAFDYRPRGLAGAGRLGRSAPTAPTTPGRAYL